MISIACLMPTLASHKQFRPVAEACFARQVYPSDWKVELLVDENETDSLGKKLNRMIAGTNAEYIILWELVAKEDAPAGLPFAKHYEEEDANSTKTDLC